jgi:hypothetical protein
MKSSSQPNETVVNPASFAEERGSQPLQCVDHLVMDQQGKRRLPPDAHFREETRARNLGHAAGHSIYGEDVTERVLPPAAAHSGKEAWLQGSEPRRDLAEQKHEQRARIWSELNAVPHNALDPHRKVIAYVAKAGFVLGDTAVLSDQLYRSGTPLWLAALVGLSLAVTVVMVGTQCGHEMGAENQRKLRGPAPADSPPAVRTFYDSGDAEVSYKRWLYLAYAAGAAMFLSLFFLGVGSGDPAKLALGYGLLGCVTVAGSVCAEAYATNDAAENLKAAELGMNETGEALGEFETAEADSAVARTTATLTEAGARHRSVATSTTVTATADRLPDTPEVAGYIDAGHIPVPPPPPVPVEIPVVAIDTVRSNTRSRKRPSYSLNRPVAALQQHSGERRQGNLGAKTSAAPRTSVLDTEPAGRPGRNGAKARAGA